MKTIVILKKRLDSPAHGLLAEALEHVVEDDLWLDASGVEMLGARCLEVILSARCSATHSGKHFHIIRPSEAFENDLISMGQTFDDLDYLGAAA